MTQCERRLRSERQYQFSVRHADTMNQQLTRTKRIMGLSLSDNRIGIDHRIDHRAHLPATKFLESGRAFLLNWPPQMWRTTLRLRTSLDHLQRS